MMLGHIHSNIIVMYCYSNPAKKGSEVCVSGYVRLALRMRNIHVAVNAAVNQ